MPTSTSRFVFSFILSRGRTSSLNLLACIQGGYEHDESPTDVEPVCTEPNCTAETPRAPLDLPLSRRVWIDPSVTLDQSLEPKVRSGVVFGDGDGTVSLLSLGAM